MEAEVYPNDRIIDFVNQHFIPVKIHIKEQPKVFHRFDARWTPTAILLDSKGKEQHRFEGFLPVDDFLAQLRLGLAKLAFDHKDFEESEKRFRTITEDLSETDAAPEALYWAGVSRYKASDDGSALSDTASALESRYPGSTWAKKASVWLS